MSRPGTARRDERAGGVVRRVRHRDGWRVGAREVWGSVLRFTVWELSRVADSTRRVFSGSGPERDVVVQSLKAAFAGILAWAVTGWWWGAPMALLAPWVAMLLMESTVYRSLRSAFQQLVVIVIGTVVAAGAVRLTGDTMMALLIALPVTVLVGTYARFGQQGLYAATTALFVLAYGSYAGIDIGHRLLESLVGAVIGIGVNALVLPPVHARSVRHARCQLLRDAADLLCEVSEDIRDGYRVAEAQVWESRAVRLRITVVDLRTAHAWAEESYRYNPGSRLRRFTAPPTHAWWEGSWDRATDHIQAITRTLLEAAADRATLAAPPAAAIGPLSELLRAAGRVCHIDHAALAGDAEDEPGSRAQCLDSARNAHDRLRSGLSQEDPEIVTSLGGLTAGTQRLLHELARPPEEIAGTADTPRSKAVRQ